MNLRRALRRTGIGAAAIVGCIVGLHLLVVTLFVGCSQEPAGWSSAAPSSDLPRGLAGDIASIAARSSGGVWSTVSATGSMRPWIDEKAIVILVPPRTPVQVGDIVSFDISDTPNVLHRVVSASATHLYISGDNNRHSDGWYPRNVIKYRLAGVLYTEGAP